MRKRLYKLREVTTFLDSRKKWIYSKAEALNYHWLTLWTFSKHLMPPTFNCKKNINITKHYNIIRTFVATLDLWKSRFQQGNPASFWILLSQTGNLEFELRKLVITNLNGLQTEFSKYFPDIEANWETWKLIRIRFSVKLSIFSMKDKKRFLSCSSTPQFLSCSSTR